MSYHQQKIKPELASFCSLRVHLHIQPINLSKLEWTGQWAYSVGTVTGWRTGPQRVCLSKVGGGHLSPGVLSVISSLWSARIRSAVFSLFLAVRFIFFSPFSCWVKGETIVGNPLFNVDSLVQGLPTFVREPLSDCTEKSICKLVLVGIGTHDLQITSLVV